MFKEGDDKVKRNEKKSLAYANKPIFIFLIAASLPWLVPTIRFFIKGDTASGFKFLAFSIAYMIVLFIAQIYFRKMLIYYERNLNKSVQRFKNKKTVKVKGGL